MPREIPTKAQIEKLPQWAQSHIKNLERERDAAMKTLKEFNDTQTPSNVFYTEHPCLGEKLDTGEKTSGPQWIARYIQSNRVQFKLPRAEMDMEVFVNAEEQRVEIRTPRGYPYIEPQGGNLFHMVPKEDMYLTPNATTLCRAAVEAPKLSHDAFVKKYGFSQSALEEKIRQVVPKSHWNRTV